MIRFVNVTHHYGVKPVLRQIDMEVPSGELVAVMGPNGMGKSTLLGVAAGVLWPIKGYTEINGRRRRASVKDELAIRRQTVYLTDHPWIPANHTGREFLIAVGRLYEIDIDRLMEHCEQLLRLFDLAEQADVLIRRYSNGQQKKIAICSALITEAKVMILDEPFTGGLDPSGIFVLKKVLKQLAERSDVTILMATQLPEVVDELAHRIAIVRNGELTAYATPAELKRRVSENATLQEAMAELTSPKTEAEIAFYFEKQ
ncbi:MAG TPA: ABC transporter ATP-binding protein [Phycisphaerae bacterium]|nr:ABC transporter ATP-binding protein [Phycisphaerae bacterium]HRW55181.1 ABC transporter ATP-binding protein [Phycisphaerae bacterium]